MATNNRRRDLMDRLDKAYGGKMYLSTRAVAMALGFDRDWLSDRLKAAGVPCLRLGNRTNYEQHDIRDWLYQMESAS